MVTMTTTVFKKMSLLTLGLACAAGVIFSVGTGAGQSETDVHAATVETKRAWCSIVDVSSWWFGDSAKFMIHYFGGGVDTSGEMLYDTANSIYYFDVPTAITTLQWYRQTTGGSYNWTTTPAYGSGTFYIHNYTSGEPAKQDVGYDGGGTHFTTTIVTNFAASTNGICTVPAAQDVIDNYNTLSTFEQDQYDILNVGEGITGLQRLTYFKSRFGITTPLNAANIGSTDESSSSLPVLFIIGIIGLSTLGAYYIFLKKRKMN